MPSGSRAARALRETGSAEAKTMASAMRTASAGSKRRSSCASGAKGMTFAPVSLMNRFPRRDMRGRPAPRTHEERCEGAVLANFQLAFAHQFEARSERTRNRRGAFFRRRHVADEEHV